VVGVVSSAVPASAEICAGAVDATVPERSALISGRTRSFIAVHTCPVGGAQAAGAIEDGDRIRPVVGWKAIQSIERLDRLGIGREIVGGIVLPCVLELAGQRSDREQDHEPDADHRELRAPATEELS
jgi:hypothetical protein